MEIWKDIPNYIGYQASNTGKIRNKNYNNQGFTKELKPIIQKTGYYMVNLSGKVLLLHRVIADTFIPNPNNYPQVNHINGIKTDNSVDNLEWCTCSYNLKEAYKNKLKVATSNHLKKKINQYNLGGFFMKQWESTKEIERKLGICHTAITNVCKHKKHYNTAGGYKWEYAE